MHHRARSFSARGLFHALRASVLLATSFPGAAPTVSAAEIVLVEEGGFLEATNLAVTPGSVPFAINSLAGFPIHYFTGLNDGLYGNSNSWIADSGAPGFAGISFGERFTIRSLAFGRDNTSQFADRCLGRYVLQRTTVDSPNELTPDQDWLPVGEVRNDGLCPAAPALRHRYNFPPVEATGIRLLVPGTGLGLGTCLDELEVYTEAATVDGTLCGRLPELELIATGGPLNTPAVPSDVTSLEDGNLARAPGAIPFATPPHPAPIHQTPGLTDGLYGNDHSWLGNEAGFASQQVYAGVYFSEGPRILGYLFLGQGVIPAPGPPAEPCGEDPASSAAQLGCAAYARC